MSEDQPEPGDSSFASVGGVAFHYETTFRIPRVLGRQGDNDLRVRVRPRGRPDLPLIEVGTRVRMRLRRLGGSDGAGADADTDGVLEIEPAPLGLYDVELPDADDDGVSTLVEVSTELVGRDEGEGGDSTLDRAAEAASSAEREPGAQQVETAFAGMGDELDRKVREELKSSGVEADASWKRESGSTNLAPPETTVRADRTSITVGESVRIEFSCDKPVCVYRCALAGRDGSFDFRPCENPLGLTTIQPGEIVLFVRAVDVLGNKDASPERILVEVSPKEAPPVGCGAACANLENTAGIQPTDAGVVGVDRKSVV
jgi:hypothetical protein